MAPLLHRAAIISNSMIVNALKQLSDITEETEIFCTNVPRVGTFHVQ